MVKIEQLTDNQKRLILDLIEQGKIDKNSLDVDGLTKETADNVIKKAINGCNSNELPTKQISDLPDYPIAFQAFVKSACELYKNRSDKTFKDIIKEVKEVY